MSDTRMKLEVLLAGVDKLSRPLRDAMAGNKALAQAVKHSREQLKALERQQSNINGYKKQAAALQDTRAKLDQAQQRVRAMREQMRAGEEQTAKFRKAFTKANESVHSLTAQVQRQTRYLAPLRAKLSEAGVKVAQLGNAETALKGKVDGVTRALKEQQRALEQTSQRSQKLQENKARLRGSLDRAGQLGMPVVNVGSLPRAIVSGMRSPIEESKHYQTEFQRVRALGIGDKEANRAKQFAANLNAYGVSATETLELDRDAWAVFADRDHAEMVTPVLTRMKFANKAMFGEGEGQEKDKQLMDMMKVIEMRGGANNQKDFMAQANKVQQVIAATGGRVGPNEWYRFTKRSGLAGQGLSNEAFYYKMEPVIQEMGGDTAGQAWMSAYQNLYQGRTTKRAALLLDKFDLIGDRSKIKHDKAGQVSFLNPGALKGAATFKTDPFKWIDEILLPTLEKKGIKDRQQIEDVLGGIFTNRNASGLFGKLVLQRKQFAKSAAVNARADNIDQIYDKAKDTAEGKEIDLITRRADAYKVLGDAVMPEYTQALEMASAAVKKLSDWMQANPAAAKAITLALMTLAAALATLAALIIPLAMLRFTFSSLGIAASAGRLAFSRLGGALKSLGTALRWMGGAAWKAITIVGKAMFWLGRVLLMNPILLLITAIAVGAYLIWRHWDTLGPKFAKLWTRIKQFFSAGWEFVKTSANDLLDWFQNLPGRFVEFGGNIMQGLVNGIKSGLGGVKDAILGVGDMLPEWLRNKLDIHSPSRVFAGIGGYAMAGLEQGIVKNQDGPLAALRQATGRLTALGAGVVLGAGPTLAGQLDTRPPLARPAMAAAAPIMINTPITIHAAPGMD
ncbi:phage tail tape measure protein [Chromobacterium haemolyticum]|uniref:phage tail tape measure protein n=1 Tax=Chromobacterium haemolyticum TaxID=394935 RepID=UPI0011305F67|nr:phage tail protein [Chromobacterium haemolyticum]